MSTFPAPPSDETHRFVEAGVQCERAMKWMDGWESERERRVRNIFSATGEKGLESAFESIYNATVAAPHLAPTVDFLQRLGKYDLHGHPQYRKNTTTTGLPSTPGTFNLTFHGAFSPTLTGWARSFAEGGGGADCQD